MKSKGRDVSLEDEQLEQASQLYERMATEIDGDLNYAHRRGLI